MSNLNMFSTAIGAAIGAYTQTGENSNAAYIAAGATVGGAVGYYGSYNTSPLERAKSATTTHMKSAIAVGDVNGQAVRRTTDEFAGIMSKVRATQAGFTQAIQETRDSLSPVYSARDAEWERNTSNILNHSFKNRNNSRLERKLAKEAFANHRINMSDAKRIDGVLHINMNSKTVEQQISGLLSISEIKDKAAAYDRTRVDNVNTLLKTDRFKSIDEIDEWMRTRVDSNADVGRLRKINSAMSFEGPIKTATGIEPYKAPVKEWTAISSGDEGVSELYKHFKSLGSNDSDSERKAKSIAQALNGFKMEVHGQELKILDGGNEVGVMPLSKWDKGIRTTGVTGNYRDTNGSFQKQGTRMISKGFNPYGYQYLGGSKAYGAKEISQVMDPEEMLVISDMFNDKKGRLGQLKEAIKRAHGLQEYIGADSLKKASEEYSELAKVKSQSVNVTDSVIKFGKDGKAYIGKMSLVGSGGIASEYHQLAQKITREFGKDPLAGSSINTQDFTDLSKAPIVSPTNPVVSAERNAHNVLIREQRSVGGTTQSKAYKALGRENELKHASQAIRKDVNTSLSELFSNAYGSQYSLDDGSMIGNMRDVDKFSSEGRVRFTLANVGSDVSPAYQTSIDNLSEIINSSQAGKKSMLAALGEFKAGDQLGIGENGKSVSLKGYFDRGVLTDVRQTSRGLELTMDAVADPSSTGWMKIFSQSSKAGVTLAPEKQFNSMLAMAKLYEDGAITLDNGKVKILDDLGISELKSRVKGKKFRRMTSERFAGVIEKNISKVDGDPRSLSVAGRRFSTESSLIADWDAAGQKEIGKILEGGSSGVESFIAKYSTESNENFLGKYFDRMRAEPETARGIANRANIARGILAMSDNKSARDIYDTALNHAHGNNKNLFKALSTAKEDMLSGNDVARANARDAIMAGVSRAYNQDASESLTIFTPDYLEKIHGAGKQGSLSWLEQKNLKLSGYSDEMLSKLGTSDQAALYELEMIRSTAHEGNVDPSKFKNASAVFDAHASERLSIIQEDFADIDKPSYMVSDIGKDSKGVKSIPIALADTGYSGLYDVNQDTSILKSLDKARREVVDSDIFYRSVVAKGGNVESARAGLSSAISTLVETQKSAMTGDNNILKNAIRLSAENSSIMIARSADGAAAKFAAQRSNSEGYSNKMFVSKSTLSEYAHRYGLDILDSNGNLKKDALIDMGNGIKRINVGPTGKWMAQVSREPVQGAFSSMAMELLVDESLTGGQHHIYNPKNLSGHGGKNLLNMFAFLDYDADILRVASMHTMNEDEIAQALKVNKELMNHAERITEMQVLMGAKGKDIAPVMISDFNNHKEYYSHQVNAGLKGRYRKPIAPAATRMVAEIQESLNRKFGNLGPKDPEYGNILAAREVAHNLTESMLKTAHKRTEEFGAMPSGAVEKYIDAYDQFIRNPRAYSEDFRYTVSKIIHESVGNSMHKGSAETNAIFKQAVDDIVDSQIQFAPKMRRDGSGILDAPTYAMGDAADQSDGIVKTVLNGGAGGGFVEGVNNPNKAEDFAYRAKAAASETKNFILDTASRNKKKFIAATAALGGLAAIGGARAVDSEQLAAATPSSEQKSLDPIRDRKAYIRKYKENGGYDISANVKTARENLNPKTINQALFGDQLSSARVNVTDKSGMF